MSKSPYTIQHNISLNYLAFQKVIIISCVLGALSYTKPESADYDSGARDLSPEPATMSLTQLMETHDPYAYKQLRQAGADAFLDIANRVSYNLLNTLF